MADANHSTWEDRLISPRNVLNHIKPGMTIFIGTGPAAPRTLIKTLLDVDSHNIRDLELVQLAVLGDTFLSVDRLNAPNHRLKTFFSGYVAWDTITSGQVDLIPAFYSEIPRVINSGKLDIDVALIQITPPDDNGYCSLGVAVDVAREAIERASVVVGEINTAMPYTYGDTFVSIDEFDLLVRSKQAPVVYDLPDVTLTIDQVAANVASVIKDGDCLSFSFGPLFEALVPHLTRKKDLGIHSLFFTDALAELVKSGAVTNSRKSPFRGKSLVSYALGTSELHCWLHRNPLVEFQGIDWVCNSRLIANNPQFVALYEGRKVDLLGSVAFPLQGAVITGPGEAIDFFRGAEASTDGTTIIGLPSRDENGNPNILLSLQKYGNQLRLRESVHMIVTEYGVANLKWRSLRERAQALIDIAHPDDRQNLITQAKDRRLIYANQIFLPESVHLYPSHIEETKRFKGGVSVRFRAMKPSDEEMMRRFFYRCSKEMIFYRFFYSVKTMDHDKMQAYVNLDYHKEFSIVGLYEENGNQKIIAEARMVREERTYCGEVAFLIDERFQGIGVGSYLLSRLIEQAKELGFKGIIAQVLADNQPMIKVFEKSGLPMESSLNSGIYYVKLNFSG
ncbi:MAG: GNAT family N-acetyltransferase [Thermodesulfobacteriota bacterium]